MVLLQEVAVELLLFEGWLMGFWLVGGVSLLPLQLHKYIRWTACNREILGGPLDSYLVDYEMAVLACHGCYSTHYY